MMKSPKVSYEILTAEVDKLYQKQIPIGNNQAIEQHCEFIASFIESCGWTVEEYFEEFFNRNLKEFFPPPYKELN